MKRKAAAQYGVKVSDVRLRFPMEENPRKPTRKARAFIGRKIRKLAHEGMKAPRRVAAAYSLARRAGFKVPKRARKNPRTLSESTALRDLMWSVHIAEQAFLVGDQKKGSRELEHVRLVMAQLAQQAERGIHENPTLAVLGNPPAKVVGTLSHRLYELRYKHAEDGKDYRHPFGPGAKVLLLADKSVWIKARHSLWEDH